MASQTNKQSLSVLTKEPFNAETPPTLSGLTHLTPIKDFYVRAHFPVPKISPKDYYLSIRTKSKDKRIKKEVLKLTMDLVKKSFTKTTVTATLHCAGNRRGELKPLDQKELPFGIGAIGTAAWAGIPVHQVLKAAGVTTEWNPTEIGVPDGRYVVFKGADTADFSSPTWQGREAEFPHSFAVALPLEVAMRHEVLLAYEMNGEPLPEIHGGPLRLIVPGFIGDRSLKWVTRITVQYQPTKNFFMRNAYKMFAPGVTKETADWSAEEGGPNAGFQLMECNVNSAITFPEAGKQLVVNEPQGTDSTAWVPIRGWAFSGGGHTIQRVDVSLDSGQTWHLATLEKKVEPFAWRLWELPISPAIFRTLKEGPTHVICRAMDSACNVQPPDASQIMNFKGYMNNSWHRVPVTIVKSTSDAPT